MGEVAGKKNEQELNEEINRLIDELARCKVSLEATQSELDGALKQIAHDKIKISELICEIDCKRSEIMPDEPIKAADCLIHAKGIKETSAVARVFHRAELYEKYDLYSVSDLREIAEHLLAYCNNHRQEENADVCN